VFVLVRTKFRGFGGQALFYLPLFCCKNAIVGIDCYPSCSFILQYFTIYVKGLFLNRISVYGLLRAWCLRLYNPPRPRNDGDVGDDKNHCSKTPT